MDIAIQPVIATARRVTIHEAKRHFDMGGKVLVSERGHKETLPVTANTTTHSSATTTWASLCADVKMWRNRYPDQRFYVVETDAS